MNANLWHIVPARRGARSLAAALLMASVWGCSRAESPLPERSAVSEVPVVLTVARFEEGDSMPQNWNTAGFTDSLASRLRLLQHVHVVMAPNGRDDDDFELRGNVAVRNGRVVVGARLSYAADSTAVWTATFWRGDGPLSQLVDDVASGAAEAIGAEMARRSVQQNKARR